MKHLVLVSLLMCSLATFGQITINIEANPPEGCGSLQTEFTDLSVSTAGDIVAWEWDLDGVISRKQNPGRLFTDVGTYTICLTVTDSEGNMATRCFEDFIRVLPAPTVDFDADPRIGCRPLYVEFEDLSSSPNGNIVEWIWDVGGTTGVYNQTNPNDVVSTTYVTNDEFSVTLTIRDDKGCVETLRKDDFIQTYPSLQVDFTSDITSDCNLPADVNFENNTPNQAGNTYFWSFGNGQTFNGYDPPTIRYEDEGEFDVFLVVNNATTGCSDTLYEENYISTGGQIDFDFDISEGCAPLTVAFDAGPWNTNDVITWDFGDGMGDNGRRVRHTYVDQGTFTVTLNVNTADGCMFSVTKTGIIDVTDKPQYELVQTNTEGCQLTHIAGFELESNQDLDVTWVIDDEVYMEDGFFTIPFNKYGTIRGSYVVTDELGCSDEGEIEPIVIQRFEPLIPDMYGGCEPLEVDIDASQGSVGNIISWDWEIGTNPPRTYNIANPQFTIPDTGTYSLKLTVVNDLGCEAVIEKDDYFGVGQKPEVNAMVSPPFGCVTRVFKFFGEASDIANSVKWDFGDGSNSVRDTVNHQYSTNGTFDVQFIAFHNGCPSDTFEDRVRVFLPVASFDVEYNCENALAVQFLNNSVGADSLIWDFGDGSPITAENMELEPVHEYATSGEYVVNLRVFNFQTGCIHNFNRRIEVFSPTAAFTLPDSVGCAPFEVIPINTSENGSRYKFFGPGIEFQTFFLKIGQPVVYPEAGVYDNLGLIARDVRGCLDTFYYNGTVEVSEVILDPRSTKDKVCYDEEIKLFDASTSALGMIDSVGVNISGIGTFTISDTLRLSDVEPGFYSINYIAVDDYGCSKEGEFFDVFEVVRPEPLFQSDSFSCTLADVDFKNKSVGVDLMYEWTFGDGGTSTDEEPVHVYTAEGDYDVCLKVTDLYGCVNGLCLEEHITVLDPLSDFGIDNSSTACPPLTVNFTNSQAVGRFFEWDFGDNSGISSESNPSHIYTFPGDYSVTLIAIVNERCRDTLTLVDTIHIGGTAVDFDFDIKEECKPVEITVSASSPDPVIYTWDFGDGEIATTGMFETSSTFDHTYDEEGEYYPVLLVTGADGCEYPILADSPVIAHSLSLEFNMRDEPVCDTPANLTIFNLSTSTTDDVDWMWEFEGGIPSTSTEIQPFVTFNNTGVFIVTLNADNGFCQESRTDSVVIISVPPRVDFEIITEDVCEGDEVFFNDLSFSRVGALDTWVWQINGDSVSNQQNYSHVFDDPGQYDITLIVGNEFRCLDTLTKQVNVSAIGDAEVTAEEFEICLGEWADISVVSADVPPGATTYWLINDVDTLCKGCMERRVYPEVTTTYAFVIETASGCVTKFPLTITLLPFTIPDIDLVGDTTSCYGIETELFVTGMSATDVATWNSPDASFDCTPGCTSILYNLTDGPVTFDVNVTTVNGCDAYDTIQINIIDDRFPFGGTDRTICSGDSVELFADMAVVNPSWTGGNTNCTNCPSVWVSETSTTDIFVSGISQNDCPIFDTVQVIVRDPSMVDAGEDACICVGESVLLQGIGFDGAVRWEPAAIMDAPTSFVTEALPDEPTQVYLIVGEDLCEIRDSLFIDVKEEAQLNITGDTICYGEDALVSFDGLYDNLDFDIVDGTQVNIGDSTATLSPEQTVTIDVTASFRTCRTVTQQLTVVVNPLPPITVSEIQSVYPTQPVDINLVLDQGGAYDVQWGPLGHPCPKCTTYTVFPDSNLFYTVMITDLITGCVDSQEVAILLRRECGDDLVYVPNAFSPNNDYINDAFGPQSLLINEVNEFAVFDRWGNRMFRTEDMSIMWDGTTKGLDVPAGIYVYYIDAVCFINGLPLIIKGDVLLVR